jgi:uncharacterized protein
VKAYIDSSVLLRIAFRSPNPLAAWNEIEYQVSSSLLRVECARALQRMRFDKRVSTTQIWERSAAVQSIIEQIDLIAMHDEVLDRASGAFIAALKSLDAIHLATAMMWRDHKRLDLAFATHDYTLARAAGFEVFGA